MVTRSFCSSQTKLTRLARQPVANVDGGVTQPSMSGVSVLPRETVWPARPSRLNPCQWPGSSSCRKNAVTVNGFVRAEVWKPAVSTSEAVSCVPSCQPWTFASAADTAIS
jgi:hypothetical protein